MWLPTQRKLQSLSRASTPIFDTTTNFFSVKRLASTAVWNPKFRWTQVHAPEMRLWDASLAKRLPDIQVAFAELESPSSGGLLRVSAQLATYGISFVRGVPVEPGMGGVEHGKRARALPGPRLAHITRITG